MGCDFRSSFKMMARFSVSVRATFECRDYISQFLILLNAHQSVCVCVCIAFQYFRPADANRKKFSFIWSYFSMKHLFWSPLIYERVRRFFHVDFIRYVFVSVFFLLLNFKLIQSVEILRKVAFKIQSILQVHSLNCMTRSIQCRQWLYFARSFSFAHFSLFILYIFSLAIWL